MEETDHWGAYWKWNFNHKVKKEMIYLSFSIFLDKEARQIFVLLQIHILKSIFHCSSTAFQIISMRGMWRKKINIHIPSISSGETDIFLASRRTLI